MVEGAGLENRCTGNGIVGSNPTLSVQATRPASHAAARRRIGNCARAGALHALLPGGALEASARADALDRQGRVAEWFKAHAWKVCVRRKRTVGSNPTPSVEVPERTRVAARTGLTVTCRRGRRAGQGALHPWELAGRRLHDAPPRTPSRT